MHRVPTPPHATRPMFLQQTETLAASMKRYAPFQLESVLKVNPQLALRAFTDIQDWNASIPGSPALLSYHGLAYSALDAATLSGRISPSLWILSCHPSRVLSPRRAAPIG
ncbi:MAG: peroxide stress protein YaaA [Ruthenibacterium lactatiformans]